MGAFEAAFAEQNPVVGDDTNGITHDTGEAGDKRRAITRLELVQDTPIDDTRDDLSYIELTTQVARNNTVKLDGIVPRWLGATDVPRRLLLPLGNIGENTARDRQRVQVV